MAGRPALTPAGGEPLGATAAVDKPPAEGSTSRSPSRQRYRDLVALAPGKLILVAETAPTESGGNKARWMRDAFLTVILTRFPEVAGVIWFVHQKETS